ncbi:MAG: PEP-CTERM/exosortase system-associated acyltransferase, partial [Alphaproteobacteria bacterium]|nr:PEP-CTERM/exosortase system-associated acyltransferase [Alphaproteobacteria bacterium]
MELGEIRFSHGNRHMCHDLGLDEKSKTDLLYSLFNQLFDVVHCRTEAQRAEAHRLRYQVFCLENEGYEDPNAFPDQKEQDPYDSRAAQAMLIYKPRQTVFGGVRMILPNPGDYSQSFPVQQVCPHPQMLDKDSARKRFEFSRFCISKTVRNLIRDDIPDLLETLDFETDYPFLDEDEQMLKLAISMAPFGLVRAGFEVGLENGLPEYCGAMDRFNVRRLGATGIEFHRTGPDIEHHGVRTPFFGTILGSLENAFAQHHAVWKVISVDGKNHRAAM